LCLVVVVGILVLVFLLWRSEVAGHRRWVERWESLRAFLDVRLPICAYCGHNEAHLNWVCAYYLTEIVDVTCRRCGKRWVAVWHDGEWRLHP